MLFPFRPALLALVAVLAAAPAFAVDLSPDDPEHPRWAGIDGNSPPWPADDPPWPTTHGRLPLSDVVHEASWWQAWSYAEDAREKDGGSPAVLAVASLFEPAPAQCPPEPPAVPRADNVTVISDGIPSAPTACPCGPDCHCETFAAIAPRPGFTLYVLPGRTDEGKPLCPPCEAVTPLAIVAGVEIADAETDPRADALKITATPTLVTPSARYVGEPLVRRELLRVLGGAEAVSTVAPLAPAKVNVGVPVLRSWGEGPRLESHQVRPPIQYGQIPSRWDWPRGMDLRAHLAGGNHRIDASGMSDAEAVAAHDADHNRYGSVPTRVRGAAPVYRQTAPQRVRYSVPVQAGCPSGACPR